MDDMWWRARNVSRAHRFVDATDTDVAIFRKIGGVPLSCLDFAAHCAFLRKNGARTSFHPDSGKFYVANMAALRRVAETIGKKATLVAVDGETDDGVERTLNVIHGSINELYFGTAMLSGRIDTVRVDAGLAATLAGMSGGIRKISLPLLLPAGPRAVVVNPRDFDGKNLRFELLVGVGTEISELARLDDGADDDDDREYGPDAATLREMMSYEGKKGMVMCATMRDAADVRTWSMWFSHDYLGKWQSIDGAYDMLARHHRKSTGTKLDMPADLFTLAFAALAAADGAPDGCLSPEYASDADKAAAVDEALGLMEITRDEDVELARAGLTRAMSSARFFSAPAAGSSMRLKMGTREGRPFPVWKNAVPVSAPKAEEMKAEEPKRESDATAADAAEKSDAALAEMSAIGAEVAAAVTVVPEGFLSVAGFAEKYGIDEKSVVRGAREGLYVALHAAKALHVADVAPSSFVSAGQPVLQSGAAGAMTSAKRAALVSERDRCDLDEAAATAASERLREMRPPVAAFVAAAEAICERAKRCVGSVDDDVRRAREALRLAQERAASAQRTLAAASAMRKSRLDAEKRICEEIARVDGVASAAARRKSEIDAELRSVTAEAVSLCCAEADRTARAEILAAETAERFRDMASDDQVLSALADEMSHWNDVLAKSVAPSVADVARRELARVRGKIDAAVPGAADALAGQKSSVLHEMYCTVRDGLLSLHVPVSCTPGRNGEPVPEDAAWGAHFAWALSRALPGCDISYTLPVGARFPEAAVRGDFAHFADVGVLVAGLPGGRKVEFVLRHDEYGNEGA